MMSPCTIPNSNNNKDNLIYKKDEFALVERTTISSNVESREICDNYNLVEQWTSRSWSWVMTSWGRAR